MDRKSSLLLSILITTLIAGNYFFFTSYQQKMEKVIIERVLDGDTVELLDGRKVRLANINTPEKNYAYSNLAKNYLTDFIGKEIYFEKTGVDKYSRNLGRLFYENQYINLEIVKRGMAHIFLVYDVEIKEFSRVEKEARENKLGIWERSEFYGCLDVEINKYEEYVDIIDSCGANLVNWNVKDESTKTYVFKKDFSKVRLYSKKGMDNSTAVFWKKEKIWNDDGDSIFVRDSNGLLVYYERY